MNSLNLYTIPGIEVLEHVEEKRENDFFHMCITKFSGVAMFLIGLLTCIYCCYKLCSFQNVFVCVSLIFLAISVCVSGIHIFKSDTNIITQKELYTVRISNDLSYSEGHMLEKEFKIRETDKEDIFLLIPLKYVYSSRLD